MARRHSNRDTGSSAESSREAEVDIEVYTGGTEGGERIEVTIVFSLEISEDSSARNLVFSIALSPHLLRQRSTLNVVLVSAPEDGENTFDEFIRKVRKRQKLKEDLKRVKPYIYSKNMPPKECAICLSKFEVRQRIRMLACQHEFHKQCVDQWLLKGESYCPICRQEPFREDTSNSVVER